LLRRPLLEALEADGPVVLLIDEIDRADDEFEAFLLELLSDFQVTIPELGTITAKQRPLVVLTSNRTRELHDALKRRCLYHWIDYPTREREAEIVRLRAPAVAEAIAARVVEAVARLRDTDLYKLPGVGETIAWAQALAALGEDGGLRRGGVGVGGGEVEAAARALAAVDAASRTDSRLALRAVLCSRREDLPVFEEAFLAVFGSGALGDMGSPPDLPPGIELVT